MTVTLLQNRRGIHEICRVAGRWRTVRLGSVQAAGDLSNLCRRVLASERRSRYQMPAHGEPADDNGLEPDFTNEALGDRDRFRIVARDRHPDRVTRAMCNPGQPSIADRVERADDV